MHQSEWLRSKTQMTADTGKDVEKEEHSSIVGGIASWYNHSGNQSGSSSPEFLILAILTDARQNLRVVLICISLMIQNVEQFFKGFSAILYSSVENYCLDLYPIFNRVV